MNTLEATKPSISTAVCVADLGTCLDIESIFDLLQIDETFLGIKYHLKSKGQVNQTGSFFNQISINLVLRSINKTVNLKVFTNGRAQMTGVKTKDQASEAIMVFLKKSALFNGIKTVETVSENGLLYNKAEFELFASEKHTRFDSIKIYGKRENAYIVVGERKGTDYSLFVDSKRINVFLFQGLFLSSSHTKDHVKTIFNKNGETIGYTRYIFLKTRKNVPIVSSVFVKDKIVDTSMSIDTEVCNASYSMYDKYKNFIGKQFLFFKEETVITDSSVITDPVEIEFFGLSDPVVRDSVLNKTLFGSKFQENIQLKTININCNFQFKFPLNSISVNFDRERMHNTFVNDYNLNSYYNPESKYQALNIKLYFDEKGEVLPTPEKCHFKTTVLLFRTGQVIVSGCKSNQEINIVKGYLMKIIKENKFQCGIQIDIGVINYDITILDII